MNKTYTRFKLQRRREFQQNPHRQQRKSITYFEHRKDLTVEDLVQQGELFTAEKLKQAKPVKLPHRV